MFSVLNENYIIKKLGRFNSIPAFYWLFLIEMEYCNHYINESSNFIIKFNGSISSFLIVLPLTITS